MICYYQYEIKAQYLKNYLHKYEKVKLQFPPSIYNAPAKTNLSCNIFPLIFNRNSCKLYMTLLHCFPPYFLRVDRVFMGSTCRLWCWYSWYRFLRRKMSKSGPKYINFLHTLASSASSRFFLLAVCLSSSFFWN